MNGAAPEPVFDAPWHAQLFALTVHMNEAGHFSWMDWAERFGATLRAHGMERELNGGEDYFMAWLEALERLMAERDMAGADALSEMRAAWERAYLRTPHGHPVTLDDAVDP